MLQGTSIRKWERQRGGGWRSEVLEQLRSEYYALEEGVEALDPDVADNVVNYWINGFTIATGDLIRTGAAELLASEPKLSSKIDVSIFQSI